MQARNGAEPILEVKNLKTHLFYPSPGPSPKHHGGERYERSLSDWRTRRLLVESCKQRRKDIDAS